MTLSFFFTVFRLDDVTTIRHSFIWMIWCMRIYKMLYMNSQSWFMRLVDNQTRRQLGSRPSGDDHVIMMTSSFNRTLNRWWLCFSLKILQRFLELARESNGKNLWDFWKGSWILWQRNFSERYFPFLEISNKVSG